VALWDQAQTARVRTDVCGRSVTRWQAVTPRRTPRTPARHALLLRTGRASLSLPLARHPLRTFAVELVAPAPLVVGERLHSGAVDDASALLSASVTPTAPPSVDRLPIRGPERHGERGPRYSTTPGHRPSARGAVRSEDSFAVLRTVRSCRTIQHPDGNAWCG